jgi:hypothetical protein
MKPNEVKCITIEYVFETSDINQIICLPLPNSKVFFKSKVFGLWTNSESLDTLCRCARQPSISIHKV